MFPTQFSAISAKKFFACVLVALSFTTASLSASVDEVCEGGEACPTRPEYKQPPSSSSSPRNTLTPHAPNRSQPKGSYAIESVDFSVNAPDKGGPRAYRYYYGPREENEEDGNEQLPFKFEVTKVDFEDLLGNRWTRRLGLGSSTKPPKRVGGPLRGKKDYREKGREWDGEKDRSEGAVGQFGDWGQERDVAEVAWRDREHYEDEARPRKEQPNKATPPQYGPKTPRPKYASYEEDEKLRYPPYKEDDDPRAPKDYEDKPPSGQRPERPRYEEQRQNPYDRPSYGSYKEDEWDRPATTHYDDEPLNEYRPKAYGRPKYTFEKEHGWEESALRTNDKSRPTQPLWESRPKTYEKPKYATFEEDEWEVSNKKGVTPPGRQVPSYTTYEEEQKKGAASRKDVPALKTYDEGGPRFEVPKEYRPKLHDRPRHKEEPQEELINEKALQALIDDQSPKETPEVLFYGLDREPELMAVPKILAEVVKEACPEKTLTKYLTTTYIMRPYKSVVTEYATTVVIKDCPRHHFPCERRISTITVTDTKWLDPTRSYIDTYVTKTVTNVCTPPEPYEKEDERIFEEPAEAVPTPPYGWFGNPRDHEGYPYHAEMKEEMKAAPGPAPTVANVEPTQTLAPTSELPVSTLAATATAAPPQYQHHVQHPEEATAVKEGERPEPTAAASIPLPQPPSKEGVLNGNALAPSALTSLPTPATATPFAHPVVAHGQVPGASETENPAIEDLTPAERADLSPILNTPLPMLATVESGDPTSPAQVPLPEAEKVERSKEAIMDDKVEKFKLAIAGNQEDSNSGDKETAQSQAPAVAINENKKGDAGRRDDAIMEHRNNSNLNSKVNVNRNNNGEDDEDWKSVKTIYSVKTIEYPFPKVLGPGGYMHFTPVAGAVGYIWGAAERR